MNDFLTTLVARSFGRPRAIRPRLASLFEPVPGEVAEFRAPARNAMPCETTAIEAIEPQALASSEPPDGESGTSSAPTRRAHRVSALTAAERVSNAHTDAGAELTESVKSTSAPETAHGGLGAVQVLTRMSRQKPILVVTDPDSSAIPDPVLAGAVENDSLRDISDGEPSLAPSPRRMLRKKSSSVTDLKAANLADKASIPGGTEQEMYRSETRFGPEAPLTAPPIPALMTTAPFETSAEVVTQVPSRLQGPMNLPGPATDKQSLDNGNARNEQNTMLVPPPGHRRLFNTMTGPIVAGDRRESMATASAQAEPEPSIQVTISRIEIRAETTGDSARKTERAASPVMGLEEYLRRQGKRGRG